MYRRDMRPEIVSSFIEEFNIHGPKLTLDAVSSRIHISKKTIYRFFRSKDEIYDYILKDAVATIAKKQKEIYEDPSLSTLEKLERILTIKTTWEEKIDFSKAFMLKEESPLVLRKILQAYDTSWDYLEKLIDAGKEEGIVKVEVETRLLITYIRSSMESLYEGGLLEESKLSYSDAITQLAGLILHGILR